MSLIPIDTILPQICAFIIGFSCTELTKMRSLAGSLADDVLADANLIPLIPPRSPIPSTNKKVRDPHKSTETSNKKPCLVNKKGDIEMVKCFSEK